jgi:hypothetical protein
MDLKESQNILSGLSGKLTENDKRTFVVAESFGKQMSAYQDKTLHTIGAEQKVYNEQKYTALKFGPVEGKGKNIDMVIAFNARNVYVDGKSIRQIGQDGEAEDALSNLAMFTVDKIEETNTYPWTRSKAAENLGLLNKPSDEYTQQDWNKLRAEYEAAAANQRAASGVSDLFEIVNVHITPVTE